MLEDVSRVGEVERPVPRDRLEVADSGFFDLEASPSAHGGSVAARLGAEYLESCSLEAKQSRSVAGADLEKFAGAGQLVCSSGMRYSGQHRQHAPIVHVSVEVGALSCNSS